MKLKVILIVILTCVLLCGCTSTENRISANKLYPMQLKDTEQELIALVVDPSSTILLSAELDESFKQGSIFLETYKYGELIDEQSLFAFDVDKTVDLAVINRDICSWDINVKSTNSAAATKVDLKDNADVDATLFRCSAYLGYEVKVKRNEPQIIEVYYFDESKQGEIEVSLFEKNLISNIEEYEYTYVMKVVFN